MLLDQADIVVVGGGVVGLTTAYALKQRGFDVVLVEQRFVAFGASGRNSGAIWVQTMAAGPPLEIARRAKATYAAFAEELGNTFDYRADGGLLFYETEAQAAIVADYLADRGTAGVAAEHIALEAARELAGSVPENALGAVFCPEDAQVNTAKFTRAVAEACRRLGVRIYENTAALTLIRRPGGAIKGVRTVRGDLLAEGVIWCTGAWSVNLESEGITLPLTPLRAGMMVTQPVSARGQIPSHGPWGVRDCSALTELPSFDAAAFTANGGESGLTYDDVVTQSADGNLLVGHTYDDAQSLNPHVTMDATLMMLRTVLHRRPEYGALGVTGLWAGLIGVTSDGLPIIDQIDGLYVNTGHGFGTSSGPVSAELIAQLVAGEGSSELGAKLLASDRSALQASRRLTLAASEP